MRRQTSYDRILILDFGSQYTQLIARRVRECKVYSEIHPYSIDLAKIRSMAPKGIILSGGPASVYEEKAPRPDGDLFRLGIPILGICYGMQLMAHLLGGQVTRSKRREYGKAKLLLGGNGKLFRGLGRKGSRLAEQRGRINPPWLRDRSSQTGESCLTIEITNSFGIPASNIAIEVSAARSPEAITHW